MSTSPARSTTRSRTRFIGTALALATVYVLVQYSFRATDAAVVWFLAPLAYGAYCLLVSDLRFIWRCPHCSTTTLGGSCADCGRPLLVGSTALSSIVRYVVVVPAGAAVAELPVLVLLDAVVLDGAQLFGYVGPLPFMLLTSLTAMIAATAAIGVRTLYVAGRPLLPVEP